MRALPSVGLVALLAWGVSSAGCASDDDEAPGAAGTGGTSSAQGGGAGRMGSGGAAAASGGSAPGEAGSNDNGDAGAGSASGGSSNAAGAPNGDAGDANAGAAGASSGVPYANVVSVVVAAGSEGAYTFSVSIESSDIDCSEFANWWEVLTEDGALSYRRILDHSHTDANGSSDADKPGNTFTRSGAPVPIAADTVVLVRAHLSTGGYNGRVMRGSATEGFTQAPEIGADFAIGVEDDEPQPTGCAF